jgi:hypothetical protein
MTKIWRKKEWEQQLKNNPDACISIPKGLILNKSEADENKFIREDNTSTRKKKTY